MRRRDFQNLRKFVAPEFVFGLGSLSLAGQYGRNLGGHKALVVADPGVEAAGWVSQVLASTEAAGLDSTVFTQVTPNPRLEEVQAGAARFLESRCDTIIAVGGGSVIDCAKAIGVVSANGGNIRDFIGVDNVGQPMPPTICIPTTAGTSADVSQFAVLSDQQEKRKVLIISKAVVPDIALIDPATSVTMSPFLTACTGIDALSHAIEAYVSLLSILPDGRTRHGSHTTPQFQSFRSDCRAEESGTPERHDAGESASRTGLLQCEPGSIHAMAHSLGGLCGTLPHGQCNAMLFDRVTDFNSPEAEERYRNIAQAMGLPVAGLSDRELRQSLVREIRRLREAAARSGRTCPFWRASDGHPPTRRPSPARSLHCHQPAAPCPSRPGSDL